MPCYFILAERSIPMGFRSMVSSTLISIAAIIRAWRSLKQGEKEKGGPER